jgi:plasmid stability protein
VFVLHPVWVQDTHTGTVIGVKTIQIRNVPDSVYATLRARAAGAGVSLSDFALAELQRVAERPPVSDVLRRATSRAGGAGTAEIVTAVRAGRDRE